MIRLITALSLVVFLACPSVGCEAAANSPPLVAGKWTGKTVGVSNKDMSVPFEITLHPNGTLSVPELLQFIASLDATTRKNFIYNETIAAGSSAGVFFNTHYDSPPSVPYRYENGKLTVDKALLTTRTEEFASPRYPHTRKRIDFFLTMEATVSTSSSGLTLKGSYDISNSNSAGPPGNMPFEVSSNNMTAQDWLNAGNDAFVADNLELALSSYQKALELKPDWDAPMANIAQVYAAQGNYSAALQQVNQALDKAATNKKYHQMLWNRSHIHELMGNTELANKDRAQARTAGITGDPASGKWED